MLSIARASTFQLFRLLCNPFHVTPESSLRKRPTRAFQYAGARSVLASLWKVEDKSTAELMKRFYGYLKAGRAKDDALRLAQIDLIRSADFSQPRDWAAFQLNGDWK